MKYKLILALSCLILLSTLCFSEEVSFKDDDSTTWTNDVDKFKDLDLSTKKDAWESVSTEEKEWISSHLASKIRNAKKENGVLKPIHFIGTENLEWKKGKAILTDGKADGITIDLERIPEDVTKITYDEENGLTYEYENGGEITVKNGQMYEDSTLWIRGKNKVELNLGKEGKGKISIDKNGNIDLENGAIVKIGNRRFLSPIGEKGSMIVMDNRFGINNLDIETDKIIFSALKMEDGEYFTVAFEEPREGEYENAENTAWIYGNSDDKKERLDIKVKGDNVFIDLKKEWLENGNKPKAINLEGNGKNIIYGIGKVDMGVDGERTLVPPNPAELDKLNGYIELTNVNEKPNAEGKKNAHVFGKLSKDYDELSEEIIVIPVEEVVIPVEEVVIKEEPKKKPAKWVCIGKFCDVGNAETWLTGADPYQKKYNYVPTFLKDGPGAVVVTRTNIYAREDEVQKMLDEIPAGLSKQEFGKRATEYLKNNKIVSTVASDVITKEKIDEKITVMLTPLGLSPEEIKRVQSFKSEIYKDLSEKTTGSLMWKKQESFIPTNSRIVTLTKEDGSEIYGTFAITLNTNEHELKIPGKKIQKVIDEKYKIYGTDKRPITLDELYYGRYGAKR